MTAATAGPGLRAEATLDLEAPPRAAWEVLVDYRDGHPAILPRPWIDGLEVVEGGRGAGTVLDVRVREGAGTKVLRMRVTEPEPGRVLAEEALDGSARTSFTVDPLDWGSRCRVAIATELRSRPGPAGRLEGWTVRALAPAILRKELGLLAGRVEASPPPVESRFLFRWLRDSALGWIAGILVVLLLAIAIESLGGGGVQAVVGLGMGGAMGVLQGRRLRGPLGGAGAWAAASALGLGLPFLLADLLGAMAGIPYALPVCVVAGGLLAGVLQARLLRPRYPGAGLWIPASVLAWSVGGGAVLLADRFARSPERGRAEGIAALALWVGGGVLLGLPGGIALRRILGGAGRG